jgi:hypothetical protein
VANLRPLVPTEHELIASESSALLDLPMQQVSTQAYLRPCDRATAQHSSILDHPRKHLPGSSCRSRKVTSSCSHLCERIAYEDLFSVEFAKLNVECQVCASWAKQISLRCNRKNAPHLPFRNCRCEMFDVYSFLSRLS